jgi:hypothetical protein
MIRALEAAMKRLDLSLPEFGFVVATRAALGAGIGLLLADRLCRKTRRGVGLTLVTLGALTTIPAAMAVFGGGLKAGGKTPKAA